MGLTSLVLFIFLQTVIALREEHAPCDDVEIVWREDWKARPSVRRRTVKLPLLQVIIQHTVTPPCKTKAQCIRNVQFIQDYHLDYKGIRPETFFFIFNGNSKERYSEYH
ncbi:hypothetical protein AVEN_19831-1 [Araneus ventricosus]|uniref:Uncharacterized protein n=1 Tax=Araneus ventricosus TaxID=182803 RepID=A0A4Y2NTT5_ARAVE|nr:hypothetical protein AVEN_19831-1 [Araneus ventricosus]